MGSGGGGAMFNPIISPHDPNTVMVSSDMTGSHITHDGGGTWRMFNLRGAAHFFAFDPVDPKTIYAGTGALWRSTDGGQSWKLVYPKPSTIRGIRMNSDHADETIIAQPDPLGHVFALAIDPDDHRLLYAAAAQSQSKSFALFVSRDSGGSWQELNRLPEEPRRMWIDSHSPGDSRRLFVASSHFISVRRSSGLQSLPAPSELTEVSLGFGNGGRPLIYATSPQGLFVSKDGGRTWQKVDLPGGGAQVRAVATSLRHPDVAYVSYDHLVDANQSLNTLLQGKTRWMGVAKTTDAGKTWHLVWKESEKPADNVHDAWISERFGAGWAGNPRELAVAEQDGGANWTAVYSRKEPGLQWKSTGLDVTTDYGIHFDPFDSKRQFITFTDIGLFRSEDAGNSWQSSTSGVPREWLNTTYWIVFDPKVRGRAWSVNSYTHDLPRPKMWRHTSVLDY